MSYIASSKVLKPLSKLLIARAGDVWDSAEKAPIALSRLEAIEDNYDRVRGGCICLLIGNGRHRKPSFLEPYPCEQANRAHNGCFDHKQWFRYRRTREYVLLLQPYSHVVDGAVERLVSWGTEHGLTMTLDDDWAFYRPRSEDSELYAVAIRVERADRQ